MLFQLGNLSGVTLAARDGMIGRIEDFYFDDEAWTIRYLVADTAGWLLGRKVLIPRLSLGSVQAGADKLEVKLTKEQIESSPEIDTHKPVSRQSENDLRDYDEYPYYWPGPNFAGPVTFPIGMPERTPPMAETEAREIRAAERRQNAAEAHLRSTSEVAGYHIDANDGDIGHIEDFLVEDESWKICYAIVDTKNWWPGKKVLISPEWIKDIRWSDSIVSIAMSRQSIKESPEYDPSRPPERSYEERLRRHYGTGR